MSPEPSAPWLVRVSVPAGSVSIAPACHASGELLTKSDNAFELGREQGRETLGCVLFELPRGSGISPIGQNQRYADNEDDVSSLLQVGNSARTMKRKLILLARRYKAALKRHLRQSPRAGTSVEGAQKLGRQAVALRLETLDMARIHEQSVVSLDGAITKGGNGKRTGHNGAARKGSLPQRGSLQERARAFFAHATGPIEETHLYARESTIHVGTLSARLQRRTVDLAASKLRLKQRIVKRKTAEEELRQSGEHQARLLKESVLMQQRLSRLTHRLLGAQESERKKISSELRDEIAQTLLGINVRLLALKADAAINTVGFHKEIGSTQQLVAKSAKAMHRVARGFGQDGATRRVLRRNQSGMAAKASLPRRSDAEEGA